MTERNKNRYTSYRQTREESLDNNLTFVIDDSKLLSNLCGPNDCNLKEMARLLESQVRTRGNTIVLESSSDRSRTLFRDLIDSLINLAENDENLNDKHVNSIFWALGSGIDANRIHENILKIPGGNSSICPRSRLQSYYIHCMLSMDLVFSVGPAGTGKTYLAIACALMELLSRKKRKIVLTRPVVESGENLGFLPGDLTQKLAPYLRPLYDAMEDIVTPDILERLRNNGQVEVAPLAYMRGRSLKNCCIILDEAQNTTVEQMIMFLTRLGEGSRAVVTGDLTQVDLPKPRVSGLLDAVKTLKHLDEAAIIEFTSADVVRHPLVRKIIDAYAQR